MKLTKKQALEYKKRWERVELVQANELRAFPISLKFKQLCFLMNSFRVISIDPEKESETARTRQRWATLRKRWKHARS